MRRNKGCHQLTYIVAVVTILTFTVSLWTTQVFITVMEVGPNQVIIPQEKDDVDMFIDQGTTAIQEEVSAIQNPLQDDNSIITSVEDGLKSSTNPSNSTDQVDILDNTDSDNSQVSRKVFNTTAAQLIHELVCNKNENEEIADEEIADWKILCSENFVRKASHILLGGEDLSVVQIGAHIGFEDNDPIASGLSNLLDEVSAIGSRDGDNYASSEIVRNNFHWTFVEPSPPNFKRLQQNLKNHSICDMKAMNVAVVPEGSTSNMTFYSIRDTIDPETGYDSLSGKKLPFWITQVSSFSKRPILHNTFVFTKNELDVNDYIVETNVKTLSFSDLMKEALGLDKNQNEDDAKPPFLVLIDTEGFDCDIVQGISPLSPFLPEYLMFEHKQCKKGPAIKHLEKMGYSLHITNENAVAIKQSGM